MKFLSVENLEAGYGGPPVISGISLELEPGEFLAVCGPNGSGKSTLVKAIQKLTPWLRGKITVNGRNLFELRTRQIASLLAYVPQVFEPIFDFSVEETVAMARYYRQPGRLAGFSERDRAAVEEAMKLAEVFELREKKLNELSGGERQRVLISRALAQDTPVLLLDEPSSHLDLNFQLQVYRLLQELQKDRGKAILVAEHNLNLAAAYCSSLVFIKDGKIIARGRPQELLEKELIKKTFRVEVEVRTNRSTGLPEISLVHPGPDRGLIQTRAATRNAAEEER
ncbi:MAG: ABC transporter (iron.B12.siderophore.hemin), ATP-binding component [Candidatus Saccharicenans subterraneus]|uniref:ABC transporter (Iron.B12.siderophore.hemin), ATP-binding component n=1 Tax=Candidatus Saccharicenans subterraneus TaxID=2508984 RepID=A0A3E2BNC8_9BACT|nr:MAG: ABC transporter (iron.B12.siderophore.hemin), ATP-binding component [Candidatus Saccharicenans subterraneum]